MRNQIPSDKIDHYPDLLSCFRGGSNQRQREEYRRFLYRAIKTQLTQRQKQVVMMHFFDGLTLTEIAKQMCVNKSTVSRTLSRALDRLTDLARLYFELKIKTQQEAASAQMPPLLQKTYLKVNKVPLNQDDR